jgi:hypothetical protein
VCFNLPYYLLTNEDVKYYVSTRNKNCFPNMSKNFGYF